jgi:hypothetical protein
MATQIEQLFDTIGSAIDERIQQTAILQLTYILERSNMHDRNKPEYLTELSPEQLKVILSPDEQESIVRELLKQIDNGNPFSSSLMWAVGKATPNRIISLVQEFLLNKYAQLDGELLYQSIIALQNCFVSRESAEYKDVIPQMKPVPLKVMFEALSHSPDKRISEQAKTSLEILEWYEQEEGRLCQ